MLVATLDRDGLDCGQGPSLYRCAFVVMKDVVCAHGLVMFCSLLSVVYCILYAACGRVYHMVLCGSKVSNACSHCHTSYLLS